MTNPEALRRAMAAEEAWLAQCEKERAVPSTRAACRPKNSFSMGWLTISESIRAALEIPFEVDLLEKASNPEGTKDREGR